MIDLGFFVRAESLISFLNDLGVLIILTALNVWMWAGSENSPKYGKSQGHVPRAPKVHLGFYQTIFVFNTAR